MENEVWKKINNFSSYDISTQGRIRNKKGIILKERKNNRGYHLLDLMDDLSIVHSCLIHRLLAETFIEDTGINPDGSLMNGKHQVNHKDGNKDNNSIDNLEWCDQSYNMKEAYKLGLRKYVSYSVTDEYREKMRISSSRPSPGKEIQMLDKNTLNVLEIFESSMDAVRKHPELNLKDYGIRDAANHRRGLKTYKGFKWRFTGNISNGNKCRKSKK